MPHDHCQLFSRQNASGAGWGKSGERWRRETTFHPASQTLPRLAEILKIQELWHTNMVSKGLRLWPLSKSLGPTTSSCGFFNSLLWLLCRKSRLGYAWIPCRKGNVFILHKTPSGEVQFGFGLVYLLEFISPSVCHEKYFMFSVLGYPQTNYTSTFWIMGFQTMLYQALSLV